MGMFKKLNHSTEVQKVGSSESNVMCLAYGCPLVGAISDSTRPPHRYFCRHHFGTPSSEWPEITQRVREAGERAKTLQEQE